MILHWKWLDMLVAVSLFSFIVGVAKDLHYNSSVWLWLYEIFEVTQFLQTEDPAQASFVPIVVEVTDGNFRFWLQSDDF